MDRPIKQRGFTAVEGILIAVVVAALVLVGYLVVSRQSQDKAEDTNTTQTENDAVTVPSAPEVTSTSDLDRAEQTLDEVNFDAGAADISELEANAKQL